MSLSDQNFMKVPVRARLLAGFAGAALALLSTGAVVHADEVGVTDDTIKIGMFGPLTGPGAINGYPISNGPISLYLEQNEKGGIHGRKIEIVNEDDACDPAKALAAVKKLINRDQVFMIHGGTCSTAVAATTTEVEESGVPHMLIAATMDKLTAPVKHNIFSPMLTGSVDGRSMGKFAGSIPGAKRVAIVGFASEWADTKTGPLKEELAKVGAEVVADENVEIGVADTTAQVLKIKAAKPDVIVLVTYPTEAAIFLRDAWKHGLRGKFEGSPRVVVSFPDIEVLEQRVGEQDPVQEVYGITILKAPYGSPELKPYMDIRYKHFPDDLKTSGAYQGLGGGLVIIEALQRAGRDLTREKFIQALESMNDFDGGPNACRFSFSSTNHQGCNTATFWTMVGDKVVPVGTEWRDVRSGG